LEPLRAEYEFFINHCTRRTYVLEFSKCTANDCHHCSSHPVRAVEFMKYMKGLGGRLPTPTKSSVHDGHYLTKLELDHHLIIEGKAPIGLDEGLPSKSDPISYCPRGCSYVIQSKADGNKHDLLCHYTQRTSEQRVKQRERKLQERNDGTTDNVELGNPAHTFVCHHHCPDTGMDCSMSFPTSYMLRKHKLESGHLKPRKRQRVN
ncbi:unnamed protein product, partial [Owenia fusiformis]